MSPVRKPAAGHIYVLELTGGLTKVGYAMIPAQRLGQHARDIRGHGREILRRWVSPKHVEAGLNEEALIASCLRLGGRPHGSGGSDKAREWFSGLRFEDVIAAAESLPFTAYDGNDRSIEETRITFGEIVDRARFTGEPTRITRQGKPAAVVVSVEWYENTLAALNRPGEPS
jgi:prevent-host-death family protein